MVLGALRRGAPRVRPLRSPLALLIASYEGRAFHGTPHVPTRRLRGDLAGTGWWLPGEDAAIWLAGYLAVWNDPDVLSVTSPWLTTRGRGIEVCFGTRAPTRAGAAITWGHRPQWALPLRLPRGARATATWARQLALDHAALPQRVPLGELVDIGSISSRWRQERGLGVPLGVGETGPVLIDLAMAPHALVAGATGAGKSELLISWILLMAATRPPDRLHFVLIDFKGGATATVLTGLPHVVDTVSDLDAAGARRVVTSLRAELRRREEFLARGGGRDIADADGSLPRLVVVVDEFRALTDDIPETLEQLVRLAAQGRSLGVHLVLATQRPGGAVTPEIRANVPLRLALRTTEEMDSRDIIGSDAAAHLPAVPGRAIRSGSGLETLQIAWAEHPDEWVDTICSAWNGQPPSPPWLPVLPDSVSIAELNGGIAMMDYPESLARRVLRLPERHLHISGGHGRGRTTAARTCAVAAWLDGESVWLVSSAPFTPPGQGFGGVIAPSQTRAVLQMVRHAAAVAGRVVFDDVDDWIASHDSLHGPGTAAAVLDSLMRSQARAVLVSGVSTAPWQHGISDRIHLAGRSDAEAALSGLGREARGLVGPGPAGRAVYRDHAIQWALPYVDSLRPRRFAHPRGFPPLPPETPLAPRPGHFHVGHDGTGDLYLPHGPVVIVGPRGSGKTATARLLADQADDVTVLDPAASGGGGGGPIIATCSPDSWASAFGGVLGELKSTAAVVWLRPDLAGRVPSEVADQLEAGSPGFAVVVNGSHATAVRIARPDRRGDDAAG